MREIRDFGEAPNTSSRAVRLTFSTKVISKIVPSDEGVSLIIQDMSGHSLVNIAYTADDFGSDPYFMKKQEEKHLINLQTFVEGKYGYSRGEIGYCHSCVQKSFNLHLHNILDGIWLCPTC
jgi:hypothetical protein